MAGEVIVPSEVPKVTALVLLCLVKLPKNKYMCAYRLGAPISFSQKSLFLEKP